MFLFMVYTFHSRSDASSGVFPKPFLSPWETTQETTTQHPSIPGHPCRIPASRVRLCPRHVLSERFLHSKRKRAGLRSIPQAVMSGALMLSNLPLQRVFLLRLMKSR